VSRKTRNRQLAKQAARRQAEKRHKMRTRKVVTRVLAGAIALGLVVAVFAVFVGGSPTRGSGTPTPSGSPSPSSSPGTRTGTVAPAAGPKVVACGGARPKEATEPKPQFGSPGRVLAEKKTYAATIQTSCGTIVVRLLTKDAPTTANSFAFLAEQGFYDGLRFVRLDPTIDVIQGGSPTGTASGGPGYATPDELTGSERYGPGVVAMANSGPNTNGSQFFIVSGDEGHLLDDQGRWTIFGRVVEGMDVVRRIQRLPVVDAAKAAKGDIASQAPRQAVYIERVTISETEQK
jgi:cyclophilin family peptidyl-prolyl cis-trans isomerase